MSDEQVSELRYIEELEAEVEQAKEACGVWRDHFARALKRAEESEAEVENLREELELASEVHRAAGIEAEKLQRSTVHALYQGQKKRAEAAEAEAKMQAHLYQVARVTAKELKAEVERLRRVAQSNLDLAWEAEAKLAEVEKERDKWRRDYEDEVNDPYRDAFMQDIQRARELVEELITPPVTRSPWPAGAQEDLQTIARLLSGKAE